jgi:hypothetical protein
MSTVDPFVYPTLARSLVLFALSVNAAAERRDGEKRSAPSLELTLTTRADASSATIRVARRTMSHPEVFMRAFDEMLEAYGLEQSTIFSHALLFVSTASDCAVRFAKSPCAVWTRDVVEDVGDEVQCWFIMDFEWSAADGARERFLRDTFGTFLDGLRVAVLFNDVRARVDSFVYGDENDARSTPDAATVFVNCARRIGISDSPWAATVRVVIGSIEHRPSVDRDGVSVYINGSLMPWRQARALVDHLWTLDRRFESFGLPPLREDLTVEPNAEHIVYFAAPSCGTATSCVRRVVIHFLSTTAKPADVARSAFPLASVAAATKTTMISDIPIRVSAELSTAGIFDALQILKRDDPMRLSSAEEKEFMRTSDRIGRGVLGVLESPSSEVARDFCSRCDAEDPNWRQTVLHKLRSSRVCAAHCVEMK